MNGFTLDPELAKESVAVVSLRLCDVRLMDKAAFPWLLLIPRRSNVAELGDLNTSDRWALIDEVARVSDALTAETGHRKLNVAKIGNRVNQMHMHVVARSEADALWPEPIWGRVPDGAYPENARDRLVAALRTRLSS